MPHVGIFELEFKKNYCPIRKQHPRFCVIAKFCEKTKKPNKFWMKNLLFGFFWAKT